MGWAARVLAGLPQAMLFTGARLICRKYSGTPKGFRRGKSPLERITCSLESFLRILNFV
jgi:hypothetical protein